MPYIIRNAAGEICGRCTNAPGAGNKLPDGSVERVEYVEGDTLETIAFVNAQDARIAEIMARPSLEERVATLEAKG